MTDTAKPLSEADLDEMLARCEAATEGPWKYYPLVAGGYPAITSPSGDPELGSWMVAEGVRWDKDAEFLTHARTDMPRLIAALRDAREQIKRMQKILGEAETGYFD